MERHQIKDYNHQHINPLFYGEIKYILEKNQFRIHRIETNRRVIKGGIIYPFIKWFIVHKTKKKFPDDPNYISDVLLEGEILIIIAKKM